MKPADVQDSLSCSIRLSAVTFRWFQSKFGREKMKKEKEEEDKQTTKCLKSSTVFVVLPPKWVLFPVSCFLITWLRFNGIPLRENYWSLQRKHTQHSKTPLSIFLWQSVAGQDNFVSKHLPSLGHYVPMQRQIEFFAAKIVSLHNVWRSISYLAVEEAWICGVYFTRCNTWSTNRYLFEVWIQNCACSFAGIIASQRETCCITFFN